MDNQLKLSELLMYSTVRIETVNTKSEKGCGTGFFFEFLINEENKTAIPCIVTNKHVIKNSSKGRFRFTITDNSMSLPSHKDFEDISFNYNFSNQWIFHPDENVDLCVLPIANILAKIRENGKEPFILPYNNSLILSEDEITNLNAIEDIITVGYPNGIWDSKNNLPIFRKGITAIHPKFDYDNKSEFLIDCAIYNGSSGSPILLYKDGLIQENNSIYTGQKIKLLGVVFATYLHTLENKILKSAPTNFDSTSINLIPNHVGIAVKASKILDFEQILQTYTR